MERNVEFLDWGTLSYKEAWDEQQSLHSNNVKIKSSNNKVDVAHQVPTKHYLIFCEHNPVYTLGKSGSINHLLLKKDELERAGVEFYKINRGGDITYHGPGQIVGYPIFDLDDFFHDVHKYVRFLEEVIIRTLKEFDINGIRIEGFTGVWLAGTDYLPQRKICAIGVHLSRWVTMHGFALNVNTDLKYFNDIIPCGIVDKNKSVTSLKAELGKEIDMEVVKSKLKHNFKEVFQLEYL